MNPTLRQAGSLGVLVLGLVFSASSLHAQALPDSAATFAQDSARTAAAPDRIHWRPAPLAGRPDLLLHASLSFALGVGVGLATEEPAAAAGAAFSLGLAKEIFDERFDKTDLLADLVGAGLAALVTHWLEP